MTIVGDYTRVDCTNTSQAQDLPPALYEIACGRNDDGNTGDVESAQRFIRQRTTEANILNALLRWSFDGKKTQYGHKAFVILDCVNARGGICVLNDVGVRNYVRIDRFEESDRGDEILMLISYFLEIQERRSESPDIVMHLPIYEAVQYAASKIQISRFLFDHPEIVEILRSAMLFGAHLFLGIMKYSLKID